MRVRVLVAFIRNFVQYSVKPLNLISKLFVSAGTTGPVAASSFGAIVGAIINYILNYHFTFRSSENHVRSAPKYFLVALVGFCVNWMAMIVIVHVIGRHYILARFFRLALF